MIDLLQNTLDGIAIGACYALLGLGFTLVFGVLRQANLSYGPTIMFGLYLATWISVREQGGASLLLLGCVAVVGAVLAGLYVERLCFAPHRRSPSVAPMVASFALWMQIQEVAILMLPRHLYPFPRFYEGEVLPLGLLTIHMESLVMIAVSALLLVALWVTIYRTRFGVSIRATVEDPTAAALCGIRASRVSLAVFALASATGAVAGFLVVSAHGQITPMLGMWATLKGLLAMMLGGLGSLPGAVIAGLGLGVVEAQVQWYFGSHYRELIVYVAIFALLGFRPPWMNTRSVSQPT